MGWEKLQTSEVYKLRSIRTVAFIKALLLPTIYVIIANYYGLNDIIVDLSEQNNVYWANAMPISIEYLVFTMLFALMILLENGVKGLSDFSISTLFFRNHRIHIYNRQYLSIRHVRPISDFCSNHCDAGCKCSKSNEISDKHSYHGPFYSIAWIISYLLIIIGTRTLWGKIKCWKTMPKIFRESSRQPN